MQKAKTTVSNQKGSKGLTQYRELVDYFSEKGTYRLLANIWKQAVSPYPLNAIEMHSFETEVYGMRSHRVSNICDLNIHATFPNNDDEIESVLDALV